MTFSNEIYGLEVGKRYLDGFRKFHECLNNIRYSGNSRIEGNLSIERLFDFIIGPIDHYDIVNILDRPGSIQEKIDACTTLQANIQEGLKIMNRLYQRLHKSDLNFTIEFCAKVVGKDNKGEQVAGFRKMTVGLDRFTFDKIDGEYVIIGHAFPSDNLHENFKSYENVTDYQFGDQSSKNNGVFFTKLTGGFITPTLHMNSSMDTQESLVICDAFLVVYDYLRVLANQVNEAHNRLIMEQQISQRAVNLNGILDLGS